MSDLARAFAGLKQAQEPERLSTQVPKRGGTQAPKGARPKLAPLPLQGKAKSNDPEYRAVKIFIRDETHRIARRKWEDIGNGDFSDLAERLFSEFNGT